MDNNTWSALLTLFGLTGIIQGLGMKFSKSVRKKLMLDAEGVDKKYVNFKINFLIITGTLLLISQVVNYFNPILGEKMQILISAFLLLSITSDLVYKKIKRKKSSKLNYK